MYETGLGVASLLWLYNAVWLLLMINSTMAKNLRQVGMRMAWGTLKMVPMTPADRTRGPLGATGKYVAVVALHLVCVPFSWLYVAWAAFYILHRRYKDAGRPAAVREFDWKMRNMEMSFDQVVKELYALQVTLGIEQRPYDQFREDLWRATSGEQFA